MTEFLQIIPDFDKNECQGSYKITINNRSYTDYTIYDSSSLIEKKNIDVDPIKFKMFNGDVFIFNFTEPYYHVVYSGIRTVSYISGILICQNQTYGRIKNKFYYKCIPDDKRLPHFLVPYEIKGNSFSKNFKNKYVNFKFVSWDGKHPIGELIQVIGDVDKLENFYEYQLYCKSLNASIQKFNKETLKILRMKTFDDYMNIIMNKFDVESRLNNYNIFTIDSNNTVDFDDAFSINYDKLTSYYSLSVYISNVAVWMDTLNLWNSFSERIATIYMPDRKRPMLPTILSECLCSLQENKNRFALALDLIVDNNGLILSHSFRNVLICVKKNYTYEENELLVHEDYNKLYTIIDKMNKLHSYNISIKNSFDIVAYLMVIMNYYSALSLKEYKNGIYRCNTIKNTDMQNMEHLESDIKKFMKIWNSNAGQYISYKQFEEDQNIYRGHQMLELEAYVHITSPIRRIIDLLNIIMLQKNEMSCIFNEECDDFLNKWHNNIENINISMRAIRKVQIQSTLLELCTNNPDINNTIYEGYVFDKFQRNDGLYQYIVYIPTLKLVSRITTLYNHNNYEKCNFKVYTFHDEDQFKKKVRLDLLS